MRTSMAGHALAALAGARSLASAGGARARACLAALIVAAVASGVAHADPSTELFKAIRLDDPTAVRTVLLRGADPNLRDASGTPALVHAAAERAFNVVRALIALRQTDVDATNARGENALMLAALHGDLPTVKALLERGAEPNKPDWTPLHYAAAGGHSDVVRLLLENSAFIDAESPNRSTPLMMAVRQKQPTVARLLVEEGADPTLRSESGWTAAEYAKHHGEADLAKWLRDRAAEYARKYHGYRTGK